MPLKCGTVGCFYVFIYYAVLIYKLGNVHKCTHINLKSTYQVSSAKLESQSAQRMKGNVRISQQKTLFD